MNGEGVYEHYSMVLEWDPVDQIYVVTVPELPGCSTHGRTYEEAVRQGRDAIVSWIDTARAWGRTVPPPRVFADRAS
jgi:predicted RNase H-like HicB family nuclease